LLSLLENTDDERAAACRDALSGRTWDLAAARSAATGAQVAAGGGELDRLRRLAQLTAPAEDDVREASAALSQAATGPDAGAPSPPGRGQALAGRLTPALEDHDMPGDGDGPVLG